MFSEAYITIEVSSMKRSVDFYSKKLGMKIHYKGKYWSEISAPGLWIGMYTSNSKDKKPGRISIGLVVKDIKKEVEQLKKKKVKVSKIDEEDYGTMAYFKDPDGNDLYFFEESK